MILQKLPLQTAYVQRAPEMDEQPVWSTTTTYIEAGATSAGPAAKAALYFGDLSSIASAKKITLNMCRQDSYAAHILRVAIGTTYTDTGSGEINAIFAAGQGSWTQVDITTMSIAMGTYNYILLSHGSGSSTWSSFYKTGENAPYLEVTLEDSDNTTKIVRVYPQVPTDQIDGFLNGNGIDFIEGYMFAGKTGSSSNNIYVSCNEFNLTPYRYKNISQITYSVKNVNGGNSGGNSATLTANITASKEKSYINVPSQGGETVLATQSISRSVGTRTDFIINDAKSLVAQDGTTYIYLGGPSGEPNNTYKEFGGPDNPVMDDRPYIDIIYTENNYVMYNDKACEVYYCENGTTWTKCVPYFCANGSTWTECGL